MAKPSSPRILVDLAPHCVQLLAVDATGQITGYIECAPEPVAVTDALAKIGATVATSQVQALFAPSPSFILRASAEESASIRTVKSLLARAEIAAQVGETGFKAVAFDVSTGKRVDAVGASPWVILGTSNAQLDDVKARLDSLGLTAAGGLLAFPAQIGAVALTLQDLPESNRVLVWQIAETDALLACVSASGCEAVVAIPVGFAQLFEAVQAGLGLRFRSAATKLFFNPSYDFSDAAGPIAERLAALLRPSITALGVTPTTLHITGLPSAQAWLPKALSSALELELLTPDLAAFCAQRNLTSPKLESTLSASALGLLLNASQSGTGDAPWLPDWLDEAAAVVTAPAPKATPPPQPTPAETVAPVKTATSAPTPKAAPPVAKPAPATMSASAALKPTVVVKPAAAGAPKSAAPAPQSKPIAPVKAASPAPVIKPGKAAKPIAAAAVANATLADAEEVTAEAPEADTPVATKKKPVALLAAIAAVVVLGGIGAVVFTGGAKTESGAAAAPVVAAVSPEELKRQEQVNAQLLAEEMASPRSFRNKNYSFEVSDRGYLRKLTDSSKRVLVDELGWLELQGTFSGTGKPFTSGTMSDSDFTPAVNKTVREGKVIFEISGTHARFTLKSLITCLPNSIRIETEFTPLKMTEYRGPLALVYSVKMNRSALALGQRGVLAPGMATFATQAGSVALKFDPTIWGPTGEAGKQTVSVGGNLMLFEFAGAAEPKNNVLNAELILP